MKSPSSPHRLTRLKPAFILAAAICSTLSARADVKIPAIFGDHMVLQREQKVPVWGTADDGEKVTVEFAGQKVEATAQGGKWSVALAPLKASSTGAKFTVTGKNKVEFDDVLVGDVWFCSGQSNMEFTVSGSKDAKAAIDESADPRIRHFKVPHVTDTKPQTEVKTTGGWQAASPATTGSFTAVGYFFGKDLEKALDVPIGLIGCNWGGTRIEPWTSPEGFKSVPALKENFADKLDTFPASTTMMEQYTQPVLDTDGKPTVDSTGKPNVVVVTDEKGKPKLRPKLGPDGKPMTTASNGSPLAMYNAMVHPIVPFAIKGALWYQGESNNGDGMLYFEKMKALINGWRTVWNEGEFPFYWVQLAPYHYSKPEALPAMWEAQNATLSLPNTGTAVTTDVTTIGNIHPPDKHTVGHRLALWALAETYKKSEGTYASPLFDSVKIEGNKAKVTFKNADGLKASDGKPLTWFTIAGEDKKFVDAQAEVSGNTVTVSAQGVDKPAAVRFGWNELAEPNLANGAGLPASPFRTDKWTDATMPVVEFKAPAK